MILRPVASISPGLPILAERTVAPLRESLGGPDSCHPVVPEGNRFALKRSMEFPDEMPTATSVRPRPKKGPATRAKGPAGSPRAPGLAT